MPNAEEYQREKIQKLKRKQLSAREIAEKVGVPISFVYKVTTGKRFKTSLHKYRVELGIDKLTMRRWPASWRRMRWRCWRRIRRDWPS